MISQNLDNISAASDNISQTLTTSRTTPCVGGMLSMLSMLSLKSINLLTYLLTVIIRAPKYTDSNVCTRGHVYPSDNIDNISNISPRDAE